MNETIVYKSFYCFVNFPSRVNASNDHLKIKNDQVHMVSRSYIKNIKICANYQWAGVHIFVVIRNTSQ